MSQVAAITSAWQYAHEDGRIHFVASDGEHERWCSVGPGDPLHELLLPHIATPVLPTQQSQASQFSTEQ